MTYRFIVFLVTVIVLFSYLQVSKIHTISSSFYHQAFSNAGSSDSEGISNWVAKRLDETASWLHLSGDKSQLVSRATQEGPTLLLFSPDNPYRTTNDPFTLVSGELAREADMK